MVKVLTTRSASRGPHDHVHAYTDDQKLLDGPHKDLRRARAAAVNIVPTTTGAARAVGAGAARAGRAASTAWRCGCPVEDGSITDLTVRLGRDVTVDEVNEAFAAAAAGPLARHPRYTEAPLVSPDIIGDAASCVFDAPLTQATGNLVKVFGWYDNEWGYTNRLVDLAALVGRPPVTLGDRGDRTRARRLVQGRPGRAHRRADRRRLPGDRPGRPDGHRHGRRTRTRRSRTRRGQRARFPTARMSASTMWVCGEIG